jgi:hypothetical protein
MIWSRIFFGMAAKKNQTPPLKDHRHLTEFAFGEGESGHRP